MQRLLADADEILVAGEASSHCVLWSVNDLVRAARTAGPGTAAKITILEDCMSPVVSLDAGDQPAERRQPLSKGAAEPATGAGDERNSPIERKQSIFGDHNSSRSGLGPAIVLAVTFRPRRSGLGQKRKGS